MVAPEGIEDLLESLQLFMTLNEECTTGVEHLVAHRDVDMPESFGEIEDPSDRDVEADAAQQPAEDDQILDETPGLQLATPKALLRQRPLEQTR